MWLGSGARSQAWQAPLGRWDVCAGTLAHPSLEGTLLLVLGAGGAQTVGHRHGVSWRGHGTTGSTGPGGALVAAAGAAKCTVCPAPAADPCRVSNTCASSSQRESVRPC